MRGFPRWTLWALAIAVAGWSTEYFVAHFQSASFTESAMGNLFATILGVLVGVPIALELSHRQQASAHAASLAERNEYETTRKRKVLALLRSELSLNLEGINKRRVPIDTGGKREVYTQSLQDQLWAAFSDGGELQYVNNPELLATLADAYHKVRHCIMLEHKTLDAVHFPGVRIKQAKNPQDYFLEYLTESDPSLVSALKKALEAIDTESTQ